MAFRWLGGLAAGLLHASGPWPEAPVRLGLSLDHAANEVRLVWPSRPDVVHTLFRWNNPAGAAEEAWVIPGGGGLAEWTHPANPRHGFYRLRTVRLVPVVVDDFQRVPGAAIELPPLGGPWEMIGWGGVQPSQDGVFTNGVFTTRRTENAAVTYLAQRLPATPCLMEAEFRWEPTGATNGRPAVLTMACSRTNQPSWIHDLVHLRITTVGAYFDLMDGGRFRHWVKAAYAPLALGETHRCRWLLDVEAGAFAVEIDGEVILRYRHPDIPRLGGPYVFWEHYYDDDDATARLLIDRVLAATP